MNAIQTLHAELRRKLPAAEVSLRVPIDRAGEWWLGVRHGKRLVTVQWRAERGFLVAMEIEDECASVDDAVKAIREMLHEGEGR